MADKYSTIQQHQPLRVPSGWDKQEKMFVIQIDEIFDDIYRRFGRLRFEDMGEKFQNRIETDEGNISELVVDVGGISTRVSTAEGNISTLQQTATSLTTRVGTAEGNISTLQQTATALSIAVEDKYSKRSGIDITADGVDLSGSKYIRMKSGNTVSMVLDSNGIDMQTAGKVRIHAKDATSSSIIFGTDEASAPFAVGLSGDVKATSVTTTTLSVAGRLLPGIVVSETQPSGSNIVWIKPSSSTEKQWSKTPDSYTLSTAGGTLGWYRDYTVSYSANDYLSGNLYYGIRVRLYFYASAFQSVSLKARLKNGSSWIELGSVSDYCTQGTTVTLDTLNSSATTNVMNVSGGDFTVRIETDTTPGMCRLVIEDFILKAKTTSSGGFAACSVFYKG